MESNYPLSPYLLASLDSVDSLPYEVALEADLPLKNAETSEKRLDSQKRIASALTIQLSFSRPLLPILSLHPAQEEHTRDDNIG